MTDRQFYQLIGAIRDKSRKQTLDPEKAKLLSANTKKDMVRWLVKHRAVVLKELVEDDVLPYLRERGYVHEIVKGGNNLYYWSDNPYNAIY